MDQEPLINQQQNLQQEPVAPKKPIFDKKILSNKKIIGIVIGVVILLSCILEWQLDIGSDCTVVPSRSLERVMYAKTPGILVNVNFQSGDQVKKNTKLGSLRNLELEKEYESTKSSLEDEIGRILLIESQLQEFQEKVNYANYVSMQKQNELHQYNTWTGLLQKGSYPFQLNTIKEQLDQARREMNRHIFEEENINKYQLYPKSIESLYFKVKEAEAIFKNADSTLAKSTQLIVDGAISYSQFEEAKTNLESAKQQFNQKQADFDRALKDHQIATLDSIDQYDKIKSELEGGKETTTFNQSQTALDVKLANADFNSKKFGANTLVVEKINLEKRIDSLKKKLELLEEDKSYLTIKSPVNGVIITPDLNEKLGKYFTIGEEIAAVSSLDSVQVNISVEEKDISEVSVGNKSRLKVKPYPHLTFYGDVKKISPATIIKDSTQQAQQNVKKNHYLVELVIDNKDGLLKPGMTGFAKINCGNKKIIWLVAREFAHLLRAEYWLI